MPILGNLLLWKGSRPIAKTQNCQVAPSPKCQVSLPFPKPTSTFLRARQSGSELHIMKYKEAWRGREAAREAETLQQRTIPWLCLLSRPGGFLTLPLPTNLLDREANSLFQFPRVENYQHRLLLAQAGARCVPSSGRAGRQAEEQQLPPGPSFQELFSYCAAKVDSLKGLLVPWCLPSPCSLQTTGSPINECPICSFQENTHRAHTRPEAWRADTWASLGTQKIRLTRVGEGCGYWGQSGDPRQSMAQRNICNHRTSETGLQANAFRGSMLNTRTSKAQKGELTYSRMHSWLV